MRKEKKQNSGLLRGYIPGVVVSQTGEDKPLPESVGQISELNQHHHPTTVAAEVAVEVALA